MNPMVMVHRWYKHHGNGKSYYVNYRGKMKFNGSWKDAIFYQIIENGVLLQFARETKHFKQSFKLVEDGND